MDAAQKALQGLPNEERLKILVAAIAEKHNHDEGEATQNKDTPKTNFKNGDEVIIIHRNRFYQGTFVSWNRDGSWVKVDVGDETASFPAGCVAALAELRSFKAKRHREE